jgi:hypothetical protein
LGHLITLIVVMWGLGALVLAIYKRVRPQLAPAVWPSGKIAQRDVTASVTITLYSGAIRRGNCRSERKPL